MLALCVCMFTDGVLYTVVELDEYIHVHVHVALYKQEAPEQGWCLAQ